MYSLNTLMFKSCKIRINSKIKKIIPVNNNSKNIKILDTLIFYFFELSLKLYINKTNTVYDIYITLNGQC